MAAKKKEVEIDVLVGRSYPLFVSNINTMDQFVFDIKKVVLSKNIIDPATGKPYKVTRTTVLQRLISSLPGFVNKPEKFLSLPIKVKE